MDTPAPSPIIVNNKTYKLSNKLNEENNRIILTCMIISNLLPFYYEVSLSLEDFIKKNISFKVYDNTSEINSFINESILENKIEIESDNNETIKLIFPIFDLKGKKTNIEIILTKKEKIEKEIIQELIDDVNILIKENKNLKKDIEQTKILLKKNHKIDSLIIKNIDELLFLEKRLNEIEYFSGKKFNFNLLYRATLDGDKASTFHKICDNKNNLLFLIKTNDYLRFGGFMTQKITENVYQQCIKDDDAFCFSLSLKKIYNKINKYKESIYIGKDEIITFLCDIFKVFGDFFKNNSVCDDFDRNQIYFDNQYSKYEINGGKNKFNIKELEVFELKLI